MTLTLNQNLRKSGINAKSQRNCRQPFCYCSEMPSWTRGSGGHRCPPKPRLPHASSTAQGTGWGGGQDPPAQREAHGALVVRGHHHRGPGVVLQLLQDIVQAPGGGKREPGPHSPLGAEAAGRLGFWDHGEEQVSHSAGVVRPRARRPAPRDAWSPAPWEPGAAHLWYTALVASYVGLMGSS